MIKHSRERNEFKKSLTAMKLARRQIDYADPKRQEKINKEADGPNNTDCE